MAVENRYESDIEEILSHRLDNGADLWTTDLTKIPGIGVNMAEHLIRAGFPTIELLRGKSPDDIYAADCIAQGMPVDKCALYCYRLAVHYADHDGQLPEGKQNWWDWKD